jgi:4-amino-4-deoxy-L-arabinose transferase-like glycosyltransferase
MQMVPLQGERVHKAAVAGLAAVLVFVALFWRLGTPTFWDPDEAHYTETSREMVATRDWWAPFYNEEPFLDKPVLFHQLQAASMLMLDDAELAARLVPALAGLGLVLITVWFGRTMLSPDVGVVAGMMLAACPGLFALARYAILDTLFTMFIFGSAAFLAVAALGGRPRLQWLAYVFLALGVLTKGPIALVLCGLTFLIAVAVSADLRHRLVRLHWFLGLLLIVALSTPAFMYLYLRFEHAFVSGYILDENLRLFASSRFRNQPGFWFYFQILAAGLLPWTGLLVGRLVDDVRAVVRGNRLDSVETMLWAWTVAVVGFFTLSAFKLDHYVFPAAPALCLLCARAWADVRANQFDNRHSGVRLGRSLTGPFLVAIGLGCGYFLIARLALPWGAVVVPIALTAAGVALAGQTSVRGARPPRVPWLVMAALIVTYIGLIAFVLPALEHRKVVPDLARWVAAHAKPTDRVASFQLNRWNPAYRFYVGRHITFLEDPTGARAFFEAPQPFYCVMRRNAYDEFVAQGAPIKAVYEREGMVATSGSALWRTSTPLVRFVVVTQAR